MKKIILLSVAFLIFALAKIEAKPEFGVSLNFFYSSLRPYGEWIQIDADLFAWRPNHVGLRWKPYSDGRWCWTDQGWYWDSYEPFGWATYHYGRWYDDDYYGWIWVPDDVWGPSWVEWRYDDDYIGWSPLPPYASFSMNFGIHFSMGWHSHNHWWNFVDYDHFCDHRVNRYFLNEYRAERIFDNTRYRTNYYSDRDRIINGGIDRSFIERKGGYRIAERDLNHVDNFSDYQRTRGERGGDRVVAYRPSDREVENSGTFDRREVLRDEGRSSIARDKINTPVLRDRERSNEVTNERNIGRDRSTEINREAPRTIQRGSENENRNIERENIRQQLERERESRRIENEKAAVNERQRSERAQIEKPEREPRREAPAFNWPSRSERSSQSEQRAAPRREPNTDRPAPRVERNDRGNERGNARNEKESNRTTERRR